MLNINRQKFSYILQKSELNTQAPLYVSTALRLYKEGWNKCQFQMGRCQANISNNNDIDGNIILIAATIKALISIVDPEPSDIYFFKSKPDPEKVVYVNECINDFDDIVTKLNAKKSELGSCTLF